MIAAQLAEATGDEGAIDRLIASQEIAPTERPLLLHAPLLEPKRRPGRANATSGVYEPYRADQWIDVTFWIEPDRSVSDPRVQRQSETLKDFWVAGVLEGIKARRYAPLTMRQLPVERYTGRPTFTSTPVRPSRSDLPRRGSRCSTLRKSLAPAWVAKPMEIGPHPRRTQHRVSIKGRKPSFA
ncbi:hypothetical protein [Sphingomonas jeddahensis]|uniref:hypothetical protein n=1 Tax=Sphingomonas jeddahensis TaxID=1915074 RepID=UPI0011819F02|nr:hypothetical protein [Sphingomonas jeddahensis]